MERAPVGVSSSRAERRRYLLRWLAAAGIAALCLLGVFLDLLAQEVAQRATLVAPRPSAILYDRHGAFLTQIGNESPATQEGGLRSDYGYWPLERLPDRVVRATLALEDRRFFEHPGVDPLAILRAAWRNLRAKHRSGASTVAMQVARMQRPAARSFDSKILEAGVALALTWRYGRTEVLSHYLRLVPFGNGSHGIAHAARFYFDKPLEDLSWAEIALLSAIPQSPTRMNPLHPDGLARAVRRGHGMLDELARQQVIDAAELALAHRQLAAIRPPNPPRRPEALHAVLRYEAMAREGRLQPASVFDPRLRTTLDLDTQTKVTRLARSFLASWRGLGAEQVAVLVVKRGSGEVIADLGSNDYGDRRAGAIDFSRRPRSPGSTLKPFIYALALEHGVIRPTDVLADLPEGSAGINNADGHFLGPMLPRQALANSRNVPATNLLRSTGLDTTFRFLHTLGLHDIEVSPDSFGLSMAIGSLPTTLEKLVSAYGVLAEDGKLGDLVWFEGQRRREPMRVLSTDSARLVTSFLADPMARLPSFARYGPLEFPFPVAVKTGTSQGYRDAWTVAWSRQYLIGVWIGRGDAGTMTRLSGVGSAARLAHAIMLQLHGAHPGDLEDVNFPAPEGRVPVELCVFGGKRSNGNCGQTLTEWAKPDEMPPDELPPVEDTGVAELGPDTGRAAITVAAAHRAWAKSEGFRLADAQATDGAVQLSVSAPENNSHIWRNPDAPAALNRIALKAVVDPPVPQIVWYVDGEPFAITDPDKPVYWPVLPGAHRFQIRLPLRSGASRLVHVVVD
ncbi:penicillin-binding protein 1C [Rhizobiales bacterium GAS188]|nr:penicillin-binding protein 1C [Rhizobiales bacterium GAS188]